MTNGLAMNLIHLIFSTRQRARLLSATIRPDLYGQMAAILRERKSPAIRIGGMEDHVHLLFQLSEEEALRHVVEELKKGSSRWLKARLASPAASHWQDGYGAFSVSQSNVAAVVQYIDDQEEHHRGVTFQDEFREFLRRYQIDFDERSVWD